MYRLILESLLGVSREENKLRIAPCLPEGWKEFTLHYRYGATVYRIVVLGTVGASGAHVLLDGIAIAGSFITLVDDHQEHFVEIKVPLHAKDLQAIEYAR